MGRSNRYKKSAEQIDRDKLYKLDEAVTLLKGMPLGMVVEGIGAVR